MDATATRNQKGNNGTVTHQQIADRMGVSRTLVTQALHRTRSLRINTDTLREIKLTARELGYVPRNRTTHTIGYVMPVEQFALEAEVAFLRRIQLALVERGYRLMLVNLDAENPQALQGVLNAKTVDGIICSRWYDGKVQAAIPDNVPWILASDEDGVPDDVDLVAVDNAQTLRNIAQHLLEMGHERFCLIMGGSDLKVHRLIKRGLRSTLADTGKRGITLQLIEVMNNQEIAAPLLAAMRQSSPPTAIIAANPGQAVPMLYALRVEGYSVPGDVSLISIYDVPSIQVLDPQMTTTTAGGQPVAQRVVERLLEKIADPHLPPQQYRIAGEIVSRESVAPPRQNGHEFSGRRRCK